MFQNGKGVAQDDKEAIKWYRKSAEQGNADGQVNLGWMLSMLVKESPKITRKQSSGTERLLNRATLKARGTRGTYIW